jgi:hypothetical protein
MRINDANRDAYDGRDAGMEDLPSSEVLGAGEPRRGTNAYCSSTMARGVGAVMTGFLEGVTVRVLEGA